MSASSQFFLFNLSEYVCEVQRNVKAKQWSVIRPRLLLDTVKHYSMRIMFDSVAGEIYFFLVKLLFSYENKDPPKKERDRSKIKILHSNIRAHILTQP